MYVSGSTWSIHGSFQPGVFITQMQCDSSCSHFLQRLFPPQQYWWIAQPGTTISPPQWAIPLQGRLSATWIISCHGWKIILDHWTIAVKPHHMFDKNSLKEKYCIYYSFMMTLWHENAFHITGPLSRESTHDWRTELKLSFDVYFDVSLTKLLDKQWSCWWF